EVRPGPASRSYGIQVAQRAGVPAAVIRHASRELSRLEALGVATPQLDLFGAPDTDDASPSSLSPVNHTDSNRPEAEIEAALALHDKLRDIDPDDLTPREALDVLYALHKGIANEH